MRQTAYDTGATLWEVPVLILDVIFAMGVYSGLNQLRAVLKAGGQDVSRRSPVRARAGARIS